MKKCKKRPGVAHVDWIVAIFMFLTGVTVAFVAISRGIYVPDPADVTRETSVFLANEIDNKINWELSKEKLSVMANASIEWPLEIKLNLTDLLDNNSVIVLHSNMLPTPTYYDSSEGKVIFDTKLDLDQTLFIIYGKNTSLAPIQFNTSLNVVENANDFTFKTSKINGTITGTGLSQLKLNNDLLLETVDLSTGGAKPANKTNQVRSKFLYDDGNASIYHNSSKIVVNKTSPTETFTFTTDTVLIDRYWNGSAVTTLAGEGVLDSRTYDWIDFYKNGGNGFSIIGNDMSTTVSKSGTDITITISGINSFEIFFHEGDYTNAQFEMESFFDVPEIFVKNPLKIRGISTEKAASLTNFKYADLKDELRTNFNFNYSIDRSNISLGTKTPNDRNIILRRFPSSHLDRYGNVSDVEIRLSVWE